MEVRHAQKGGRFIRNIYPKNLETFTLPLGASVLQKITITQWSSSTLVLASTDNFAVPLHVYTYSQSSTEMKYIYIFLLKRVLT